jgi:hypothetical protein
MPCLSIVIWAYAIASMAAAEARSDQVVILLTASSMLACIVIGMMSVPTDAPPLDEFT